MSTQKMEHFIRLRNNCADIPEIKPTLDVATRWNSTYFMIDNAIKLRTPLNMIISADADLQALTSDEWAYLERMKKLLEVRSYISSYCHSFHIQYML